MPGDGWLIGDDRDYAVDDRGRLFRDETILTRTRIRLLTRRGSWVFDPTLGSRLYQIRTTKDAELKTELYAIEALQPMIDDGSISEITETRLSIDQSVKLVVAEVFGIAGERQQLLGAVPLTGISPVEAKTAFGRSTTASPGSISRQVGQTELHQDRQLAEGNVGYGWFIGSDGNYRTTDDGLLVRDATIETRVRIRWATRRGQWVFDPEFGSLFFTIRFIKDQSATVLRMARQAVQDLIDDGEILAVELIDVVQTTNAYFGEFEIKLPGGSVLPVEDVFLGVANAAA